MKMAQRLIFCLLLAAAMTFVLLPASVQAADIWGGGATPPPGVGSPQSPYQISTGEHLKWFADQVNNGNTSVCARLMNDILLNDTANWQSWATTPPARTWMPIGSSANKFQGTFDGNTHTISGIYINSASSDRQGLFGCVGMDSKGTVRNVKVASSYIKGHNYVGGICGEMYFFSTISNCESDATIVGYDYSGGITGSVSNNASLSDCKNTGSVTGSHWLAGGITGNNSNNGKVMRCANQGTVAGVGQINTFGGLIGANYGLLSDSYNTGSVSVSNNSYYVGGICGINNMGGEVTNAYNTGDVTNGYPVSGWTRGGSSLTNAYYAGNTLNGGIGGNESGAEPVNKTREQFASGEVAYLLGAAFGQKLGTGGDPSPVFRLVNDTNKVYRLTYMNGATVHAAQYYNAGDTVSSDGIEPPIMEGGAFSHWKDLPPKMPAQDVTVTADSTPAAKITAASPLPSGVAHKAYSAWITTAGTPPISLTLTSGALPAGLVLSESGEISGTPTAPGEYMFKIHAENSFGYDDKEFTIVISDTMPGSGTSGDPYQIWTSSQLIKFAELVNVPAPPRIYADLMADIALNDTSDWENWDTNPPAKTWTPLGIDAAHAFKGGFNGKNHTISGVYINSSADYQGLFGYINAVTTVENLNLTKSYIKGKGNVGGICGGLANACKIDNCHSAATVCGEKSVGGVCGTIIAGNAGILNCRNEGAVIGAENTGGIIGTNAGTVQGCRNSGTVQGTNRACGGICGNNYLRVFNAYNMGSVSGGNGTGGISGMSNGLSQAKATLENVYNNGTVTGSCNSAAICGVTNVYCTLLGCYYLDSSADHGIGDNTGNYTTVAKSAEQVASGEVAYLLGAAFGQKLGSGGDPSPVFRAADNSNAVYRLVYMNESDQHAAQYYNEAAAVSAAGVSAPQKSGHIFSHWEALPATMPKGDATTYAVFTAIKTPSAPEGLTATAGDEQVTLSWTAPADDGGGAITKYQVSMDDGANWFDAASNTGHTCIGLTNGQSYTFTVRAVNEAGPGATATESATPKAPAITVKAAPSQTIYTEGDALDLSGLVVTLHKSNGSTEDVAFADFAASGITTDPANGTTLTASNTSVTITYAAAGKSVSQSITVNPASIVNAAISPVTGSFDQKTVSQADVTTTITWGSATGVTDVKAGGISISTGNYTVSGNTLTIKKEYLAAQPTGSLALTVEFNAGAAATLTIAITDTTPPTLSPESCNYDLNAPVDVVVTIAWNSAATVTSVVYDSVPLTLTTDYTISGNTLTIKHTYLSGLSLAEDDTLALSITFNTGATATLTVHVADGHTASNNADLSSLSANGTPVSGFDPDVTAYIVTLPYGASSATVTATADDVNAQVSITQAASLPGSATVTVTAENGTTKTYTIDFSIEAAHIITVTNITVTGTGGVSSIQVGDALQMLSDILPANATDSSITWSIAAGNGATISASGLLTATTAGSVTVRATANDGSGVYGEMTVTITSALVTTYTVTFNNNGSVYATKNVNAGDSIGSAAWPTNPARSGYTFGGWFTGENGTGVQFTSATTVNASTTVYAKWTYSGGGGGDGSSSSSNSNSSSTPATPTYNANVSGPNISGTTMPISVNTNTGSATADLGTTLAKDIFTGSGTAVLTVPSIPGVNSYTLGIPAASLSGSQGEGLLTFSTGAGSITIPSGMLAGMAGIEGSSAGITIAQGDKSGLPDEVKAAIGDRPIVQLTLTLDGKQTGWNNPDAPVTVAIPYTPTAEELANPESIVIWYIDGSGKAVSVPNGRYDPATGTVTFTTTHFSYYAVSFKQVSFKDVAKDAWYARAVSFIAARDITTGTGGGKFSPEAKLTRGQIIVMLMKAYGIAPDANPKSNFADAGNTWYTGYLAAAKRLGISAGVGSNLFAPEKEITRQEMFTLLYNVLKATGQLPGGDSGKTLSDFSDMGQIDAWAKDAMTLLVKTGTIGGSNGKLTPQDTTTRIEMTQVLYNLLNRVKGTVLLTRFGRI